MIKKVLKKTFLYTWITIYREYKAYRKAKNVHKSILSSWNKNGRPVPPPHIYKIATIKDYAVKYNIRNLIETGTYVGETVEACLPVFKKIITIELSPALFAQAKEKFAHETKVVIYNGDSGYLLKDILSDTTEPCLFWRDGHYSAGITAKGELNTPVINELSHIFNHSVKNHVILIDDARCFTGTDDYPTIEELKQITYKYNPGLMFSVEDDIIRIHPSYQK